MVPHLSRAGTDFRQLMRAFRYICLIEALLLLESCASSSPKPQADIGCGAERSQLIEAAARLPGDSAADYWTALRRAAPNGADASRRVAGDLSQLGSAVDQLTIDYGLLKTCRLGRAQKIQADLNAHSVEADEAGKRLGAEKAQFQAELETARGASGRVASRQEALQAAAERLIAEAPGIGIKVAHAVAAPPLPNNPYRALDNATIYAKPQTSSGHIADLRKGQRVDGPGGGPAEGWTTLYLNDGSVGYVRTESLRPVEPNAVAAPGAAPATTTVALAARDPASRDNADPVVLLALASRQTIPGKTQSFISLLDASAETVDVSFAPGGSAAPAG